MEVPRRPYWRSNTKVYVPRLPSYQSKDTSQRGSSTGQTAYSVLRSPVFTMIGPPGTALRIAGYSGAPSTHVVSPFLRRISV